MFFSHHLSTLLFPSACHSLMRKKLWKCVFFTFSLPRFFTLEPRLALLRSRMICFVSLSYLQSPSLGQLCGSLPCVHSSSFQSNFLCVSGCHFQILNYAPMGEVCNFTWLHVYMYTHRHVHALETHTHTQAWIKYNTSDVSTQDANILLHTSTSYQKPSIFHSRLILCIRLNFGHL